MRAWSRILAFLLVALLAFWFTLENSREVVTVDLLLFRVRASVPLLVFGSMLVGMLAVFLAGLQADLRTRRLLERYRESFETEEPPPPYRDTRSEEERAGDRARLDALDLT